MKLFFQAGPQPKIPVVRLRSPQPRAASKTGPSRPPKGIRGEELAEKNAFYQNEPNFWTGQNTHNLFQGNLL